MGVSVTLRGGSGDMLMSVYDPNLDSKIAMAELEMDADFALGAHDITLGVGNTVDGKDVSGLLEAPIGNSSMSNRTRKIFIPISGWECDNCSVVDKGNFRTQNMLLATSRIYSSCIVPKDYHGSGQIHVVYVSGGAEKLCNVSCDTPHNGEDHTTGGSIGISSIAIGTADFLYVTSMGFTALGANIAADDFIGFFLDSSDNVNLYVIGFLFEYEADM